MKKVFLAALSILALSTSHAQKGAGAPWHLAGNHITTPWASQVEPTHPLPDYPRPQLVRAGWKNLNGLWDYAIVPKAAANSAAFPQPAAWQGKILVPFAIESALSGVGRTVGKDSLLWYKTTFTLPAAKKNSLYLLHFGAVDWQTEVFINGHRAGIHEGGYDPFTIDITKEVARSGPQQLEVKVWDPTDDGPQPRGKQVKKPHGIWYTSVTGIWQTVWIEAVPPTYIIATRQTPDIDRQSLTVATEIKGLAPGDSIIVAAWDGDHLIARQSTADNATIILPIPNPKKWSPDTPFLYNLTVSIEHKGKPVDQVKSYFAMRKISVQPDKNKVLRIMLNDQFVFEIGPLDQGWWPDGLYTAPTGEALESDIRRTKEMGFNLIRKHVKVEPANWYAACDRLGMLVWQDMPSGDLGARWNRLPGIEGGSEMERSPESEKIYRTEWNAIMESLYNFPCVVVWTPFNEAWGQFKTVEIADWTRKKDPSRLVNSASGGNFFVTGQIMDLHNYPAPAMPRVALFGARQALVLGEFGGLGLPLEGHTWATNNNWGYQSFTTVDTMLMKYTSFIEALRPLIEKGLSAAVYTQTTDVEVETNGLMTYDRKVIKMPAAKLKTLHDSLTHPAAGQTDFLNPARPYFLRP